jgi:phosphate transport system substrate-binding protein
MKKKLLMSAIALSAWFAGISPAADTINGAGATFPDPIYQKWFQEYKTAHPDVRINYQANGSGAGISALTQGTVDFGASDMPMTDEQIGKVKIKPLHFPTVLGAVVLTYNLPGVTGSLKFSGATVAGIYLGQIAKWNDAKIAADNPGVKLPNTDILVVHRSDASGTTFVFTDYLSRVSPEWKSKVGANTSVSWPVAGLGGAKNPGVAGDVKQTEGTIGYVELVYASENKMPVAEIKNAAGKFVAPSPASVTAAAQASKDLADDFRGSITNAQGAGSYPISSYTWLLIPSHIEDATKRKAITGFLEWMLTTGQKDAPPLSYAPLPASVVAKEKKQIEAVK